MTFILTEKQWTLLKLTNTIEKTKQHFYNEDKNKQVNSQIRIHREHLKNITKIEKYKKLKYRLSKNKQTTNKDKTIKYTRRLRYITLIKLNNIWIPL